MQKLREVRERAGLTGSELAARVGVHKSLVANIEAGRKEPSPRFVRDASIVLAIELGRDAAEIKREVFGERLQPSPEPAPSYLERMWEALPDG